MSVKRNPYHLQFFKTVPLFSGLPEDDIQFFLDQSVVRAHDKNKILCIRGEPAEHFYIVHDGWVKLFRETVEGEESVLALCTKGDSFSKAVLFENEAHPASAQVVEPAIIFEIPANIIRDRIKKDTTLAYNMLVAMAQNINRLGMQIEHLSAMNTAQRVGCFLLKLNEMQEGKPVCTLPYDKLLVARYLGMKAETFSRALNALKTVGVSVQGNEVQMQDLPALKAYCCVACSSGEECSAAKKASCGHSCGKGCD